MLKDCTLEKSGCPEPVSMRVLLSVLYPVLSLTIFGLYPSMVSFTFHIHFSFYSGVWYNHCLRLTVLLCWLWGHTADSFSIVTFAPIRDSAKLHSQVLQFSVTFFITTNINPVRQDSRGFTDPREALHFGAGLLCLAALVLIIIIIGNYEQSVCLQPSSTKLCLNK